MVCKKKTYSNGWQGKKDAPKSFKEKRGNLRPLMTEEEKVAVKVEDLAYDFACRITRLFQYLNEDAEPMEQREQSLKLVC